MTLDTLCRFAAGLLFGSLVGFGSTRLTIWWLTDRTPPPPPPAAAPPPAGQPEPQPTTTATVTVWVSYSRPETGLWCPLCAKPSGVAFVTHIVGENGFTPLTEIRYCHDCRQPLTQERTR